MSDPKILSAPLDDEQAEAPKQAPKGKRTREQVALDLKNDYRTVLGTKAGRRLFRRLIVMSGVLENPAHNSGSWTYYNAGRADVGRKLAEEIKAADFSAFQLMEREAHEEGEPYVASQ